LKGRDFQSRRKSPIKSTAASAAGSIIRPAKDFFRNLFSRVDKAAKDAGFSP